MPAFDHRMTDPTAAEVFAVLNETSEKANYRARIGRLAADPNEFHNLAARVVQEAEGSGQCLDPSVRDAALRGGSRATLVAAAWWSDPLKRKHCRVVGRRLEPGNHFHLNQFGPLGEVRPPLWLVFPDRVFFRTRNEKTELLVACDCGVVGRPQEVGWTGERCAACHDRLEEGTLPDDFPRGTHALYSHSAPVTSLAFSVSGRRLISLGQDDVLAFHAMPSGEVARRQPASRNLMFPRAPFACNGRAVAVAVYEGFGTWNAETGKEASFVADGSAEDLRWIHSIALSPDGRLTAIGADSGLEVFEPARKSVRRRDLFGSDEPTHSLAFRADAAVLASGHRGFVMLWNLGNPGRPVRIDLGPDWSPFALAFDSTGESLLIGASVEPAENPGESELDAVDSPDEAFSFSPTDDLSRSPTIYLWEGNTLKALATDVPGTSVVAFTPDGRHAVWDRDPHEIVFWNRNKGGIDAAFAWHVGGVNDLAYSPDGRTMATGGKDGVVKLWPWRELLQA